MRKDILMCENLDRARENRKRIAEGYATDFWKQVEEALRTTPKNKKLPGWIPIGISPELT